MGESDHHFPGALAEYRALREELLVVERARLLGIVFVGVAVGTLGAFGLRTGDETGHAQTGVAALTLFVLLLGAALTWRHSERLELIHVYLARYVEPLVPGMQWEQRRLDLARVSSPRWSPQINEQTIAALLFLGGAAATLVVYFGESTTRPVYGAIGIPVLAAGVVLAALRLVEVAGRNAGQRIWDRSETLALLGTEAARPLLGRLRHLLRPTRLERLRKGAPHWAKPEVPLSADAFGGSTPVPTGTDLDALRRLSGLTASEFEAVLAAQQIDAVHEIVTMLGGGLGPEGMATWLRTGSPSRLAQIISGRSVPVGAEAHRYVAFPRQQQ